jgi:hypothetical protein
MLGRLRRCRVWILLARMRLGCGVHGRSSSSPIRRTDPRLAPVIDLAEQRATFAAPICGFFAGTDAKFAFYFPPAQQYKGRFIPGRPTRPPSRPTAIRFAFSSGLSRRHELGELRTCSCCCRSEPVLDRGYRVNTEAARYCGSSRTSSPRLTASTPYGYIYGGAAAHDDLRAAATSGIWDGVPSSAPITWRPSPPTTCGSRRCACSGYGRRQIPADGRDRSVEGDPYATLNAERVVRNLGFAFEPRGWWTTRT